MCRQSLPPPLSPPSAKLMIMALEEYGYQSRRGIRASGPGISRLGYLNAYGISQLKNGDTTASASNPLLAHYSAQEKSTVEKEQIIKEIAYTITSLQSEVASLKAKGSLDANEEIKKDYTLVHELEKQVEKLSMELQLKNNFREA
ncbi:hypothetical protein Tco_0241369 [Tanacetum coccineum]